MMAGMHRRLLLALLLPGAALAAIAGAAGLPGDAGRPWQRVSAAQLHAAVAARLPVRLGLPGVSVQVSAPRLLLLPARNRLGAVLLVQVGGVQPEPLDAGEIDVVFALRYEAADRSLRAYRIELLDLRWPGVPPETAAALRRLSPALAREALGELVLHRFSARELALPDTLGFEPDTIEVQDDGVLVRFGPKRR